MKFKPGDMVPPTAMEAVSGEAINLPGAQRLVHLQFRRFVDCLICISAVKYGTNAYDQSSVDELLTLAKGVAA